MWKHFSWYLAVYWCWVICHCISTRYLLTCSDSRKKVATHLNRSSLCLLYHSLLLCLWVCSRMQWKLKGCADIWLQPTELNEHCWCHESVKILIDQLTIVMIVLLLLMQKKTQPLSGMDRPMFLSLKSLQKLWAVAMQLMGQTMMWAAKELSIQMSCAV